MLQEVASSDLASAVVLVIHAHPDDEVFATGAATIAAQRLGASVRLRLFTGGEGRASGLTEPALTEARQRKEELLAASTRLLGINDWEYLSTPGRWNDTPHAPERTIAAAGIEVLAGPVVEAIETLRPDVLLSVGPDGLTGHPDHIACHAAVRTALAKTAHVPRIALGAVLDQQAVAAAYDAAETALGRPVGSGAVAGAAMSPNVVCIAGPEGTDRRRRQALDAYLPPLGTGASADLTIDSVGSGDSVLLRFLLDASGWDRDLFVGLPPIGRSLK